MLIWGAANLFLAGQQNNTAHVLMPSWTCSTSASPKKQSNTALQYAMKMLLMPYGPVENIAEYKDVMGEKAAAIAGHKTGTPLQQNILTNACGNEIPYAMHT